MIDYKKSHHGSDAVSAAIIPFPRLPVLPDETPQQRLDRALAGLSEALRTQQTAAAAWRDALGQLSGTVAGLGTSLEAYRATLGSLADGAGSVNAQARQLEAWADDVLAEQSAASR